ncbi:MAG: GDP-mannose 4,6-dehydratase [Ignavibacteriaceae bacterium]|nr:GDP-mannose 4,6-dehydratase [Ignavibacteriaceae bacterium]
MKQKKVLIIGITGQDGAYLSQLLLQKGCEVHGTSRDAELSNFSSLRQLNIYEKVKLHSMSLIDFRSVMQTILEIKPDEIYNLAGQTSVGLSFVQPVETLESISIGTLNILEVMRFHKLDAKFYNASSGECYGETEIIGANEDTQFKPRSPYAVAKAAAFWQVANYREAYGLFACSGILFNHESPLRPQRFVTRKIVKTVCEIKKNIQKNLILGNLKINRDWGYAPEYVCAMFLMLQQDKPDDFIIATGHTISLEDFTKLAFNSVDLEMNNHIIINESLMRPSDIVFSKGNPSKANEILKWKAKTNVEELIKIMIQSELSKL